CAPIENDFAAAIEFDERFSDRGFDFGLFGGMLADDAGNRLADGVLAFPAADAFGGGVEADDISTHVDAEHHGVDGVDNLLHARFGSTQRSAELIAFYGGGGQARHAPQALQVARRVAMWQRSPQP